MNDLKKFKQLVEENYTESVNGKYDEATYRILWILKDIGISDERSEQVINEEALHKYGSSQTDI